MPLERGSNVQSTLCQAGTVVGYKDTNCHQATCYNDPKPGGENFWIEGCDPTQVLFLTTIGYATISSVRADRVSVGCKRIEEFKLARFIRSVFLSALS